MSINKEIWKQYGVVPEGMALADKLMPFMLALVRWADNLGIDSTLFLTVAREAIFQTVLLPRRTEEFQEKARWRKP